MTDWKKICCAIDFAEPSRVAMEQAADLAKRFEAKLVLVHVVVPRPSASDVPSWGIATAAAEEHERTLEEWRVEAERRAGRPVRSRILAGAPAAEILRHAREEGCELIVIGTHGRTGIARLVLGSVAARVARESACPVLVVRDHHSLEKEGEAEEAAQYR